MTINTIAEALKNLYAKLGGTDNVADVPTVAEMIDKVTEVAGAGGDSDLPEVTSADEGKVLAVDASGEWAAEQFAGYDLVLRCNTDDEGAIVNITQIKGNISALTSKMLADKPINVYVFSRITFSNGYGYNGGYSWVSYSRTEEEVSDFGINYLPSISAKVIGSDRVVGGQPTYIIYDGESWIKD